VRALLHWIRDDDLAMALTDVGLLKAGKVELITPDMVSRQALELLQEKLS
jgi:hypothetical protein